MYGDGSCRSTSHPPEHFAPRCDGQQNRCDRGEPARYRQSSDHRPLGRCDYGVRTAANGVPRSRGPLPEVHRSGRNRTASRGTRTDDFWPLMPKIKWLDLPPELRRHLFDRAKERHITREDLFALEEWRRHSPDVPEGPWHGTSTSDRSSSAEKVRIRRLSFCKVSPRAVRKSSRVGNDPRGGRRAVNCAASGPESRSRWRSPRSRASGARW